MPSNDQVILDQVLSQTREGVAESLSESKFFELFCAEQILKDYDLSYDEIQSGLVGGSHDGGIDSVYCFVNGELIEEDTDLSVFKKDVSVDLIFIQSKKSSGFSESVIEKFVTSTAELLDLSRPLDKFLGEYNEALIEKISLFRKAYEELAVRFPKTSFRYYYSTKATEVHPNVRKKSAMVMDQIGKLFSSAEITFEFIGAAELLQLARRTPKTTYILKLTESPITSSGAIAFVCLVKLQDYFDFITDDNGNLHKNIFEANVRDYQGEVQVNAAIQNSLKKGSGQEDFWWLNNGVTIIASNATQSAKAITIENPSVVNGLQTSTEIYKYFKEANTEGDDRQLQVKILVPDVVESRDRIIKATNSQTSIPSASLRATEKIHRDIEEYLRPYKIYYDRRKNYYKMRANQLIRLSVLADCPRLLCQFCYCVQMMRGLGLPPY